MSRLFDMLGRALGRKNGKSHGYGKGEPLGYEHAREMARDQDMEVRRELARRSDLRPEILYFLASDQVAEVRRDVAANPATPLRADLRLASDTDPEVRGVLARKIARLAPGLSADEQDRLRQMTYEALMLLARDQLTRIRRILAEALKDVAGAPPELIRQLAHDSELEVSQPVLEFSPVLTDEDLLEIIQSPPSPGMRAAISRRSTVTGPVADAIARSDDVDAITALLANPSAQIREETLDLLIGRAPDHEAWHEPLVRRPHLSGRAATRLARFVADHLLRILDQRSDLDAATREAVAAEVRRRVEEGSVEMAAFRRQDPRIGAVGEPTDLRLGGGEPLPAGGERTSHDLALVKEETILEALEANDLAYVVNALAARADVSATLVRKIAATQSAKGMTALAWRAGLSMAAAVSLQGRLAKIPPRDVLKPRPGTKYAFPLDPADMNWQIEFFAAMVGDKLRQK